MGCLTIAIAHGEALLSLPAVRPTGLPWRVNPKHQALTPDPRCAKPCAKPCARAGTAARMRACSVIPTLPAAASEAQLRDARDHLCGMMASFMSANI